MVIVPGGLIDSFGSFPWITEGGLSPGGADLQAHTLEMLLQTQTESHLHALWGTARGRRG